MPIVDPGNPANSWLVYKLLLAQPAPTCQTAPTGPSTCSTPSTRLQCDTTKTPPQPTQVFAKTDTPPVLPDLATFEQASSFERQILSELVLGREMPFPSNPGDPPGSPTDNPPFTYAELERLQMWIAAGAKVVECGACQQ
jgi:hypothetical protein